MSEKIKQFVIEVTSGVGQVMVISPDRVYVRPTKGGFQVDSANLYNDTKKVSDDLKKKLKQYPNDKSSYQR